MNFTKKTLIATALLCVMTGFAAQAKENVVDPSELPNILKVAAESRGWKVLHKFKTESTMTGWIVIVNSRREVAYTDDKGYLVLGELVTPDGRSMNMQYLDEHRDEVDVELVLSKATTLDISTASKQKLIDKKPVYVFYEPYCQFCSAIYTAIGPYIDAGHPVKIIPVGFLSDGSRGQPKSSDLLHYIMSSEKPHEMLAKHEKRTLDLKFNTPAPAEFNQKIDANLRIMEELEIGGTPALIVPDDNNGYRIIKNMVQMADLPEIFKSARMDSDDPRLSQYGSDPVKFPVKN